MEKKPWYKSLTLLSAGIAALGIIAPKYAPMVSENIGDAATIIGLVGSIIGRLRTTKEVSFTETQNQKMTATANATGRSASATATQQETFTVTPKQ